MADQNRSFPNEYTDSVNFTSTGADINFGFAMNMVRLRNDSPKSVYFTMKALTGATTSHSELKSSEELLLRDFEVSGMSFVATSSGGSLRVQAWGS